MVEYAVLGPLEVRLTPATAVPTSAAQRLLLSVLLLASGAVVSADRLSDELWGDRPPANPAAALRNQISRLRRVLGPAGSDLVAAGDGYRLRVERSCFDLTQFDDLVAAARRSEGESSLELMDRALALWRGPVVRELAEHPFVQPEAARLEELRLVIREERAELLLSLGRAGDACVALEALVAEHPERERARALLMEALYRQGRHTAALDTYQAWRRHLSEELGLDPSPGLQRLEQAVLRHTLTPDGAADHRPRSRPAGGSGPLTFLFTDIESSTRRWQEHADRMAGDLARHDALLRETVEAHGGHVFKHTGDGCCAVFPSASAGLAAAVAAQLALSAQDWGPGELLRARMALHTGPAESRGGDYFGPTLNRVARLMSVAHGGQILVSLATEQLVADDLPLGLGWLDLDEHRLADLDRPERIFQVTHRDLPARFPPLRSLAARRHNLPVALNTFVGRQAELDRVGQLLATARLLTLTGMGGAGKTRLAIELASRALAGFPDGVFLVELAPIEEAALVPHQVATVLGMAAAGADGPAACLDRLCRYLEPRQVLLVLDNCEHLVGSAAQVAEALLARCPKVVVLATSRETLGVPGELGWLVPSLSVPPPGAISPDEIAGADAVALFCQRSRAVQPAFTLLPANAVAIAQICRRLDGIPLALELAAARLRHLSPHQIVDRLDDRFRLLSVGARTALPHHQTLLAAVDWSYQLLSRAEQAALGRLSVFPGAFSLDAAEAVVADGSRIVVGDVLDLLGQLVDKSLVVADDLEREPRYRLLETVRHFSAERLAETGETESTRRRHRCFFLSLADATHADLSFWWDTRRWLERVRTDDGDFRAALESSRVAGEFEACLRLAVALSYYWVLEGVAGGAAWLELGLAGAPHAGASVRVRGLACLGFFVAQAGDPARATLLLGEARSLAEVNGDVTGCGLACELLGGLHYERGELEPAKQFLGDASRCFEIEDCVAGAWGCRYDLGWLALAEYDHRGAAAHFEGALELGRRSGSEDLIAHSLAALAPLLAMSGDTTRAEALADEAVQTARGLALRLFVVMALTRAAETAVLIGRTDRATDALAESLALLRDVGGQAWLGDVLELVPLVLSDEQATLLLGAHDALNETCGGRPSIRAVRMEVDRRRVGLARLLGPEAFALQLARGREQSVEQVIASALELLTSTSTPLGGTRSTNERGQPAIGS